MKYIFLCEEIHSYVLLSVPIVQSSGRDGLSHAHIRDGKVTRIAVAKFQLDLGICNFVGITVFRIIKNLT